MTKPVALSLRILLVIFFIVSLLVQTVAIPGVIREVYAYAPEFSHLAIPYGGSAFLAFACVEVVLVAVWRLLAMVRADAVFSERAFRWVTAIIIATWIATAFAALVLAFHILAPNAGAPFTLIGMVILTLGGAAIALLMTVMRALLHQATDARAEMSEVI